MLTSATPPDVARLRGVRGRAVAHVVEAAAEKRGGPLNDRVEVHSAKKVILRKVFLSQPTFKYR